jgi:hypothetical protein
VPKYVSLSPVEENGRDAILLNFAWDFKIKDFLNSQRVYQLGRRWTSAYSAIIFADQDGQALSLCRDVAQRVCDANDWPLIDLFDASCDNEVAQSWHVVAQQVEAAYLNHLTNFPLRVHSIGEGDSPVVLLKLERRIDYADYCRLRDDAIVTHKQDGKHPLFAVPFTERIRAALNHGVDTGGEPCSVQPPNAEYACFEWGQTRAIGVRIQPDVFAHASNTAASWRDGQPYKILIQTHPPTEADIDGIVTPFLWGYSPSENLPLLLKGVLITLEGFVDEMGMGFLTRAAFLRLVASEPTYARRTGWPYSIEFVHHPVDDFLPSEASKRRWATDPVVQKAVAKDAETILKWFDKIKIKKIEKVNERICQDRANARNLVDLNTYQLPALRTIAGSYGLPHNTKTSKDAIIALITGNPETHQLISEDLLDIPISEMPIPCDCTCKSAYS